MGWLRDYPDIRDYTRAGEDVKSAYDRIGLGATDNTILPASVDLRKWCSPVNIDWR